MYKQQFIESYTGKVQETDRKKNIEERSFATCTIRKGGCEPVETTSAERVSK